jgi:rhodanese-related sulfurtransferase
MKLAAIPAMLSMIPSVARGVQPGDLQRIKAIARAAFPSVKQISAQTLAEWLAAPFDQTLLIDVRSPSEFAISHLQAAHNLQDVRRIVEMITRCKPARTVLYCAVGFRSSKIASRLPIQAPMEIFNLEGSIFEWANEGRQLYRGATPVRQVHPCAPLWAGLLRPGLALL